MYALQRFLVVLAFAATFVAFVVKEAFAICFFVSMVSLLIAWAIDEVEIGYEENYCDDIY